MLNHTLLIWLAILSYTNTKLLQEAVLIKSKKPASIPINIKRSRAIPEPMEIKCTIGTNKFRNNNASILVQGAKLQNFHNILPSLNQVSDRLKNGLKQATELLTIYQDTLLLNITVHHLNYPVSYWNNMQHDISPESTSCMNFPPPARVSFVNSHWQEFVSKDGTFRMFNSYLDNRKFAEIPKIRILTMVNRHKPSVPLYCHLWFQDTTFPIVSPVTERHYIWREVWFDYISGTYVPYLLSCTIPKFRRNSIPVAVALSDEPCKEGQNVLKVIYEKPMKKSSFAVCVKGLDFPYWDLSSQLVEWLELTKLLGISKVYIYKFDVHPNVQTVLKYYSYMGYVDIIPITYSEGKPHSLRVAEGFRKKVNNFEQVIAYNDCWNRNMYKHEFISLLDIDEIIIPAKGYTWKELINEVETVNRKHGIRKKSSYVAREARFSASMITMPEIPYYLTMMRRVVRQPYNRVGWGAKSIHNTSAILTLHNHYYITSLDKDALIQELDISLAQLNHYRYCDISSEKCLILDTKNGTVDTILWKYIPNLNVGIARTLEQIECFKEAGH